MFAQLAAQRDGRVEHLTNCRRGGIVHEGTAEEELAPKASLDFEFACLVQSEGSAVRTQGARRDSLRASPPGFIERRFDLAQARSIISTRYPSGSRTKHRYEPPSLTRYGGLSGVMPCSARPARVASMSETVIAMWL
jgi:hypothetical protein